MRTGARAVLLTGIDVWAPTSPWGIWNYKGLVRVHLDPGRADQAERVLAQLRKIAPGAPNIGPLALEIEAPRRRNPPAADPRLKDRSPLIPRPC